MDVKLLLIMTALIVLLILSASKLTMIDWDEFDWNDKPYVALAGYEDDVEIIEVPGEVVVKKIKKTKRNEPTKVSTPYGIMSF